ncbi:3-oxoacyl-ACP reductase [Shewanella basaltis]|uniref:3-oxoacyl-ACP reductase n=1 Tax=Shewanella basaltis TaxID=472183 RepID=UPI00200F729C|nr:3-oxoacyl-ACP reductase [Shewanella basaltis]
MEYKIAVITGATKGIGKAITKELTMNGYFVVGLARTLPERNHDNLFLFDEKKVVLIKCDVTNEADVSVALNQIKGYGVVDVLINNAGVTSDNFFHKMTSEQWHKVINVNLNALFYITQPIYKMMRENKRGKIINISSVNGQKGQAGQVNYSSSKSGVHGFTMALAQEGARNNVLVNTISPGYTNTEMTQKISPDILCTIKNSIPLTRLAEVEDIANVVSFLVSDRCNYITGANIPVNGGLFIG